MCVCVLPRMCVRTIFQNLLYLSWDGTHISHISIGIHATKKFNERYSDMQHVSLNSGLTDAS